MSQPSFAFPTDEPDAADAPTFSVGELADAINHVLQRGFGDGVWVRGEIDGFSQRGGHRYFQLVERDADQQATVSVALFAGQHARLAPLLARHGLELGNGVKVRVFGRLDYYAPTGRLSLKLSNIDPRYTLGELALQRDEVIRRLRASGRYDANRSRPVPPLPLRVGVVTSADSAAWADFRHEIERSGVGFHLRLVDVRVQGERAVEQVSAAIRWLGSLPDLEVIAVVRGGGARTDLATFDAEQVAEAIADCPLPVLTGLGHETDRSVADEVAHLASKTPTACAAALVERVRADVDRLEARWDEIAERADQLLQRAANDLSGRAQAMHHHTVRAVERADERLRARAERTASGARRRLAGATREIDQRGEQLGRRAPLALDDAARSLSARESAVRMLDPAHTLARGWSITRDAVGRVVRSAEQLAPGDEIVTTFAAGTARSTVEETHS